VKLKLDITSDIARIMGGRNRRRRTRGDGGSAGGRHRPQDRLAQPDHRRRTRPAAGEHHPLGALSEGQAQPEHGGPGLVKAPQIVSAHDAGALIRSRAGFWLAIPPPAAGTNARGGRVTRGERERRSACASFPVVLGRACSLRRPG
jgi:hypothetical protein